MGDGDYSIDISCIDTAGNEENGTTNISVEIDNSAPQIVRLYNDHNTLSVRTDEKAACSISNNASLGCNFEILDNELKTLTTFPVVANNNYFVSCKDEFGNRDPSCSEVYIVE